MEDKEDHCSGIISSFEGTPCKLKQLNELRGCEKVDADDGAALLQINTSRSTMVILKA